MPNVPYSPVPSVVPSTSVPNDYLNVQANPNEFGAQIGQAAEKLGSTMEQAGDQTAATAFQYQTRVNNVAGDQAFNAFQQKSEYLKYGGDPNDPTNKGYFSLHGQDAVNGRDGVLAAMDASRQSIRDGLANDQQRLLFDEASRRLNMYDQAQVGSHYEQEFTRSAIETQTAGLDIKARAVANSYNDDELFQHNLADALKGADAKSALAGGNDDVFANNRAVASQTLYTARAVAMGTANPAAGLAFVQQNSTKFDALTLHKLTDEFKAGANNAADDAYVNGLLGGHVPAAAGGANTGPIANTTLPPEAQRFLPALSGGEGNYNSPAPAGDRSGSPINGNRYQFLNATWQGAAPAAGIDVNDHSREAQDAVAWHHAQDVYKTNTGSDLQADIAAGGNEAKIAGALNKVWPSLPGGSEQNTTMAQFTDRMAISRSGGAPAGTPGSSPAYPDESALVTKALADTSGMTPERQGQVLSKLTRQLSIIRLATDTDRTDLTKSLPDLQAAALGGQDITIPTDRINHLLPPAQAADELEKLNVAQQAGRVFKSIQWGTPDQVNQAHQDLSSGLGPISAMIRAKGQPTAPAGTAAAGSDEESPEAYRLRTTILRQFEQQVQTRNAALSTDPAGYVAASPSVAAAARAMKAAPNDPAALAGYVTATQAVQTSLGVPEAQQHILTAADARAQAQKLTSIDPSKGDMGQALSGVASQYGSAWPKVFGDLVSLGKLPGDYQVLAAMPDPVARTDFQRALAAVSAKGGVAQLKEDVPPAAVKDIDTGLDDKLIDFRRTASVPGLTSNVGLIATVRDSMKTLAYYYAIQNGDGPAALDKAATAIIDSKYDFDGGTMRVPKGMLPAAETATANVVANLKPEDLSPLAPIDGSGNEGADQQRKDDALRMAQRGKWVPNESDTGLILIATDRAGRSAVVKRTDGSRIEVPFKGMTAAAASAALSSPDGSSPGTPLGLGVP